MTNSLLRFKTNQKYIVFDFETEGLNLRYSKPWQLGFIVAQNKKIIERHDIHIDFEDLNVSKVKSHSILKVNRSKVIIYSFIVFAFIFNYR